MAIILGPKGLKHRLPKEELYRLYIEEKKSLGDIAKIYGVSRVAILKHARKFGISRRTKSRARLEAYKKHKLPHEYFEIDENFFSSWSDKMAYVLGLIITDGCISKGKGRSYSVSLDMNDLSLLKKVRKIMKSTHKITPSKHQKGLYMFHFAREKLTKDLFHLGIGPRKSKTVKFPDVPDKHLRHFIRGIFDGDGSVYFNPRSTKNPLLASFVSGSKAFIYKLEEKLVNLGLAKRKIYNYPPSESYEIKCSHQDSIKLFHILYDGVSIELFLERKYDKFIEGIKKSENKQQNLLLEL